jgi:NADPH-dependent curcumin reductase CurA
VCGAISGYNAVEPQPGPRNMFMLVSKKLSLRGFIVSDHADMHGEFIERVTPLVTSGDLVVRETVREGLDDAVPAFLDLLRGGNTGKMIVRLAD